MAEDRCDLLCLDLEKAERLRSERMGVGEARALSDRARGLSDPTRLTILTALSRTDELCVCDLAWVAERSENLVSHHLRLLRGAGLVESRREGKMVMYSVTSVGRELLRAIGIQHDVVA